MPPEQAEAREPILLVRTRASELAPKAPGGGPPGPPFVAVDAAFRSALSTQISAVLQRASDTPPMLVQAGLPLTVELRELALAKSNRPYPLLARADLPVKASVGRRRLIAQARPAGLESLSARVLAETGAKAERELSAIESLSLWDPLSDAMGVQGAAEGIARLAAMEEEGSPVAVEFFPWLTSETRVDEQHTIAQYLGQMGFTFRYASKAGRPTIYVDLEHPSVEGLRRLAGVRSVYVAPAYGADFPDGGVVLSSGQSLGQPAGDTPIVGVLDSGVEPNLFGSWLAGHETWVVPRDEDRSHGTFVAGLVADSRGLNDDDPRLPEDKCRFFDAQIMPRGNLWEPELMVRVEEAVESRADTIKVWNCSFSLRGPGDPGRYSQFAAFMDDLARRTGVTFVQAAGNYRSVPPRTWPPTGAHADGLSNPGEAITSITVGSLTHLTGAVTQVDHPASYSRRGPGLDGFLKPDVCHYSGDADASGGCATTGIRSLAVDGNLRRAIGTSYSTPMVSATVAHVVDSLTAPDTRSFGSSLLAKSLTVHAARRRGPAVQESERSYFGHGVPPSASEVLSEGTDSFTTMYLVEFTSAGEWVKRNFPIPACLIFDGKLRAEVFLTVAHDAIIDAAFDGESIRTSVDCQLGPVVIGKRGLPTVSSRVPVEAALSGWESDLVDRGKWSPIRTHHKRWPQGTNLSGEWGLKLGLLERLEKIDRPIQVVVLVTFRGLEPGLAVRSDGVQALRAAGHATQQVAVTGGRVRVQP